MENNVLRRRHFLSFIPALTLSSIVKTDNFVQGNRFPISCNVYNWFTFYRRDGKEWGKNIDQDIAEFAKTGIKAFEPSFTDKDKVVELIPFLKMHNIEMPSVYVNSILHEKDAIEQSIKAIIDIAEVAKTYGTKIIVTNPSPIKWGSPQLKTDAQLTLQAQAMDRLGSELRKRDLTLAYHTHDMELKAGAREFHHMLLNTSPKNVSFCFDVHWVYRGSENSEVAVFDVLKLYGKRIVEIHIRQSINGIWAELFTSKGDIDYERFAHELALMKIQPHIVIEQCLEATSPHTMDVVSAHAKDLAVIKATFSR